MRIEKLREIREGHRHTISLRLEEIDDAIDDSLQFNALFKAISRKQELIRDLDDKILDLTDKDHVLEEMTETDNYTVRLDIKLLQLQRAHEATQSTPATQETLAVETERGPEMSQDQNQETHTTNVNHNSVYANTNSQTSNSHDQMLPLASSTLSVPTLSHVQRLPKLSLPGFSGDLLHWQTFWDSYVSSVHLNQGLTDVQKFNYLRSLLEGDAAKTVSGFSLTNANYSKAIELLTERFGQKHRIIQAYMHALLQLPAPSKYLSSLRDYYDSLETYVRGLESLGESQQNYGSLLVPVIMSKLPAEIRQHIVRENGSDNWIIDDLRRALHKEITILEAGQPLLVPEMTPTASFYTGSRQRPSARITHKTENRPSQSKATSFSQSSCVFCGQRHVSFDCTQFTTKQARIDIVKRKQLCFNCLGPHKVSSCKSNHRCRHCKRKHHTSICDRQFNQTNTTNTVLNPNSREFVPNANNAHDDTTPANATILHSGLHQRNNVLLKTAVAKVCSATSSADANILFDEGAQSSFITESLADELQLPRTGSDVINLASFGATTKSVRRLDTATVYLISDNGEKISLDVLVVPTIAVPLKNLNQSVDTLPYLKGLKLAHPISDHENFDITLLIGADFYWNVVQNRIIRGNGPTAVSSKIGYLLSGPISTPSAEHRDNYMLNVLTSVPAVEDLERFWKLESIGITPEDDETPVKSLLTEYQNNCIEYRNGHYSAKLPWKQEHKPLPTNFTVVKKRTENLVGKLRRNEHLFKTYGEIIDEQERRGFIEKVDIKETETPKRNVHYIPHHGVEKDSLTTPVRIVYDCSCRQSKADPSLNDCLLSTPPQLNNLASILIRFRLHGFALTTDIEKAFLHIQLDEDDRDFTRFLWLSDPSNPDSSWTTYRFKSVLFGATCSPFMLNATLLKHLQLHKDRPISAIVERDLYVDNILSSFENETDMITFFHETRALMGSANFNLRSWNSNSQKLRDLAANKQVLEDCRQTKVLGMLWNTENDTILFQHKPIPATNVTTKREILHHISKIYDPLGLLLPVTIRAKILIQQLWTAKLEWDTVVPELLHQSWNKLAEDINKTMHLTLPRYYFHGNRPMKTNNRPTLHVFVDASTNAYGAAAYICNGNQSSLVLAKSRVAPLKKLTLPRLELLSAVLGSRLSKHIEETFETAETHFWTDSQIVLCWLESTKSLTKFVLNRVTEIHRLSANRKWRYCPTGDNPADLLTRGISFQQYVANELWNYGPKWLNSPEQWPIWKEPEVSTLLTTADDKANEDNVKPTQEKEAEDSFGIHKLIDGEKYSRYLKLLRVTAFVLRFVSNCRNANSKQISFLTSKELRRAEEVWLTSCQVTTYADEIGNLKSGKPRLQLVRQLRLFLDKTGHIRCGGRIHNAPLSEETRFPYLLPRKHHITKLLIEDAHERQLHAGTNATVTELRQRYWIPAMRQCVRTVLRKCVTCLKVNGRPYIAPDPPPLPRNRVTEAPPFTVTGVDFTGALYVKSQTGSETKAYICLFTCATSRAVHLELVPDLSEESFMQAFRRFCSRRSVPSKMISDNATTYLAAAKHIRRLFESSTVQNQLSKSGTEWQFIPKRAPWYGGWWERLIGLTKVTIKKVLGRAHVTYQTLQTVVTEVEAAMNDRPLTYVTTGADDVEPLTPAHLMYGRRLKSLPNTDVYSEDINSPSTSNHASVIKRARTQRKLIDDFKSRWKHEYLTALREQHHTTGQNQQTIEVGDVVQIHDETSRCKWKLAVVNELICGNDGLVRSARIRTTTGMTNRPIVKLYPLEVKPNCD